MKKSIFFLLSIMLVLVLLFGCTKDKKGEDTSSIPVEDTEDKDDEKVPVDDSPDKEENFLSFKESIANLDLKTSIEWEENASIRLGWIKKWMEFTFKDVEIQDLKTVNTLNQHKDIVHRLALRVEKESVQFRTNKDLQNIKKNEDGSYTINIYLIIAHTGEDGIGIQYLLDIVNCEDYEDVIAVLDYGLTLLDNDKRFAENLNIKEMFKNESIIPDNVRAFATDKIINGYELYNIFKKDNMLYAIFKQDGKINNSGSMLRNVKLCYYDYDNNEFIEVFTVEDLDTYHFYYTKGKGLVYSSGENKFLIDFNGNISEYNDKEIEYIYSPDKKYYAYAEDGNLFIKNADNDDVVIKLDKVSDENLKLRDRFSYGAYTWLDNESFIYVKGGWEWSAGYGIVNLNTLEYFDLEESFLKRIDRLDGKTLYVYYIPYGDNYPFSYGHYNLDETPYKYIEDFDVEKYPELKEEFMHLRVKLLSDDSKYLYIIEDDRENYEMIVREFSMQEKNFIKEIKIIESQYLVYNYLNYDAVLIDNKFIAFYSMAYLYLYDLQGN